MAPLRVRLGSSRQLVGMAQDRAGGDCYRKSFESARKEMSPGCERSTGQLEHASARRSISIRRAETRCASARAKATDIEASEHDGQPRSKEAQQTRCQEQPGSIGGCDRWAGAKDEDGQHDASV